MADDLAPRFDALVSQVLAPLVIGGTFTPVRPFGAKLGLAIGEGRSIADTDLRLAIDVARVRVARLFCAVDTMPEPTPEEYALAAAYNDLIQVSNHELSGAFTRSRHERVLAAAIELTEHVPPPRTIAEALGRHTLFSRALAAVRTDSLVRWWTGSSSFRGQSVPGRLLKWRSLRRVEVDSRRVRFAEMANDLAQVPGEVMATAILTWLSRTPLTDFAEIGRAAPPFRWSAPTLSLVSTPPGRSLAFRALLREKPQAVTRALQEATEQLPDAAVGAPLGAGASAPSPAAQAPRAIAAGFCEEVKEGFRLFGKKVA